IRMGEPIFLLMRDAPAYGRGLNIARRGFANISKEIDSDKNRTFTLGDTNNLNFFQRYESRQRLIYAKSDICSE
ncbi:MAG TPA: hypothetical protein VHP34_03150, partial [Alphaproteobacteria bacterium]|nr:hypothetical protein [Alphaproteobacteria bacterium]